MLNLFGVVMKLIPSLPPPLCFRGFCLCCCCCGCLPLHHMSEVGTLFSPPGENMKNNDAEPIFYSCISISNGVSVKYAWIKDAEMLPTKNSWPSAWLVAWMLTSKEKWSRVVNWTPHSRCVCGPRAVLAQWVPMIGHRGYGWTCTGTWPFIKSWSCRRDTNNQRCCTSRCISGSSRYLKTTRDVTEAEYAGHVRCLKCLSLLRIASDSVLFTDNMLLVSPLLCPA